MSKTSKTRKLSTAKEFEKKFDEGKDISSHLDLSTLQVFEPREERLNLEIKKVNLDIPQWMVEDLDRAAERIGVTRNGRPAAKLVALETFPIGQRIDVAKGLFKVPDNIDISNDQVHKLFRGEK